MTNYCLQHRLSLRNGYWLEKPGQKWGERASSTSFDACNVVKQFQTMFIYFPLCSYVCAFVSWLIWKALYIVDLCRLDGILQTNYFQIVHCSWVNKCLFDSFGGRTRKHTNGISYHILLCSYSLNGAHILVAITFSIAPILNR